MIFAPPSYGVSVTVEIMQTVGEGEERNEKEGGLRCALSAFLMISDL